MLHVFLIGSETIHVNEEDQKMCEQLKEMIFMLTKY